MSAGFTEDEVDHIDVEAAEAMAYYKGDIPLLCRLHDKPWVLWYVLSRNTHDDRRIIDAVVSRLTEMVRNGESAW